MKPGIHDIPAEAYHADPCETPSLSASIASLLCSASPLHAWAAHPKLNPNYEREERGIFDAGTVAHAILLQGIDIVQVVDAKDWRTKDAQEQRDAARAAGKVPLLTAKLVEVTEMVEAVRSQLRDHGAHPPIFPDGGKPERTLIWEEDGVTCRALLDWLHQPLAVIDDLKTTSRSADPAAFSRNLFSVGADVQAAFYLRGLEAVSGAQADFRWVVVESAPPYALSVVAPHPHVLAIGRKKVDYALALWKRCLKTDEWPGYPREVAYAELPPWEEERWLAKELREAIA